MKKRTGAIGVILIGLASSPAAAGPTSPSWGTQGSSQYVVTAWDMQPGASGVSWDNAFNGYRYRTGPSGEFIGTVHLPQGTLIESIALDACDVSIEGQVSFTLLRSGVSGGPGLATASTGNTDMPGCTQIIVSLAAPETVDNEAFRYLVVGGNDTADGQTTFGSVRILYRLQVSPPPPFPTFNDVPANDPGFQFIEALVSSGITAGCGNGNFCPNAPLTRRQMAVFLSKALGLYWPEGLVN